MIYNGKRIKVQAIRGICSKEVKVQSKINFLKLIEKKIKLSNVNFEFLSKRVNIDGDLCKTSFGKDVKIDTYKLSEIVGRTVNVEYINKPEFEYYRNTLYVYNDFIKNNIEALYDVFYKITNITEVNDMNFDLFLKKIDDKSIDNILDIKRIF